MISRQPEKIEYLASMDAVKDLVYKTLIQSDEMISNVMQHLAVSGGKNIRAKLLITSAMDKDRKVPYDAVVAAATLEILHLATLVHDDVIDDSKKRRGLPSVQYRFGKKTAVICGDYLFCKCFSMISEISAKYPEKFQDFSTAMTKICLGELRQHKHNKDLNLGVTGYLRIIAGKTSALFALSMYSGTIIGGGSEKEARKMARIGFQIGMLFQISDDCMDYKSDYETAKKSIKHDLSEGVITLPLIYSLKRCPQLKEQLEKNKLSATEVQHIISEVIHIGGISAAENVAKKYLEKAKKQIDQLDDQNKRNILYEVLEKLNKFDS